MKKTLLTLGILTLLHFSFISMGKSNDVSIVSPNANPCCRYWDIKMTFVYDENGVPVLVGFECLTGGTKTCIDGCACDDINPIPV